MTTLRSYSSVLREYHAKNQKNPFASDDSFEKDVARVLMGQCKAVLVKLDKKTLSFINRMLAAEEPFAEAELEGKLFHRRIGITKEFSVELDLVNGIEEFKRPFLTVSLFFTGKSGVSVNNMPVFNTEIVDMLPESIVFKPEMINDDTECRLRFMVDV